MTRLVLMRHAKAVPHAASDWDRPLSDRGREQAREAGQWLRAQGLLPDAAIVSSSRRTCETVDGLELDLSIEPTDDAYNATGAELADLVRSCADDSAVIVVVAHNPGVSDLAEACGHAGHMTPGSAVVVSWEGSPCDFGSVPVELVGSFVPSA